MFHASIAIASGKGGTGKTTVVTNLASVAEAKDMKVQILDCDVEAPNAHLFVRPMIEEREVVCVPVPEVDEERCDSCGECGRICRFSAIVSFKTRPLIFHELCHGCGGCLHICPTNAISERPREVGVIEKGRAGEIRFVGGKLRIGEAMSPPLIKAVRKYALEEGLVLIDAPPGNSCPVIEAVRHSDFVVLVTEPTPFGLSDLSIAVNTMRVLALPFGIVVNRAAPGRNNIREYCDEEKIEILAELPDNKSVATAYSHGELAVKAIDGFERIFIDLLEKLDARAAISTSPGPSGSGRRES